MVNEEEGGGCPFCKGGHLRPRIEEIAFRQWTDKGYLFCRLSVPSEICDSCGARIWGEETETLIAQAVQREYDKHR